LHQGNPSGHERDYQFKVQEVFNMIRLSIYERIVFNAVRLFLFFRYQLVKVKEKAPPIGSRDVRKIRTSVGETRMIVYMPQKEKAPNPYPVLINLHAGGFVEGLPEQDDVFMRILVDAVGCAVFNIDYKLAPKYKFPTNLEDVYETIKWIIENKKELNIDPERTAICGHSAGGNFSAAICMMAKERKEFKLVLQILDYPPLDIHKSPYLKTNVPTMKYAIPPKVAVLFNKCYLSKPAVALNPLVSPVYAKIDDLKGLPPALIFTAENDTLWEEGEQYANMLKKAGVNVLYKKFPGCAHEFSHYGPAEARKELWGTIAGGLKKAFR
jgi:acetyl esterase